ncbi:hypothetical protein [Campylobacter fetus]|uniref:hypothetical protein n=1 Tax=Campylobacter fetus TaxID=196 RepID=UPI00112F883E|nr:hypothetical protein [Campylobacter fetus]MPB71903.1 hypothetical protein [Campylobacter fetus]
MTGLEVLKQWLIYHLNTIQLTSHPNNINGASIIRVSINAPYKFSKLIKKSAICIPLVFTFYALYLYLVV